MDLQAPQLVRLYDDWQRRREGRELPARTDFDPLDLSYVLGHLCLIEVEQQPLRFRYRLYGTEVAAYFGLEMTSKWVDELPDLDHRRTAQAHFEEVVRHRAPLVWTKEFPSADNRRIFYEVLVLPLARKGVTVDMLMSAIVRHMA